jgi:hypothetical protein
VIFFSEIFKDGIDNRKGCVYFLQPQ